MPIIDVRGDDEQPFAEERLVPEHEREEQQNHAPQMRGSNPRIRLMTGLASRSSNCHATPAQNSIAKKIPTNTIDVPRSPCAMMSSSGTPATSDRLPQLDHRLRRDAILREHAREHQHDGELRELGRLSEPMPGDREPARRARRRAGARAEARRAARRAGRCVNAYAGTVIHSISRTDARLTANAPMMPTTIQTACGLYAPVAGVCDVGLAGREHDRQPVQRERDRRDDQRQIDVDASCRRHQPVFSIVLLICLCR